MRQCIIIGKTNVGKTLFLINFTEYLGAKYFSIKSIDKKGLETSDRMSTRNAILRYVDTNAHKTRRVQSVTVNIPIGKGKKKIEIIDTVGFTDNIHPDVSIRKAISRTLALVRSSDVILHMLDANAAKNKELSSSMGEVDYQIAQFAQLKRGYAILANKMDLPAANQGLVKIKQEFNENLIFPISALYRKGFKEVKTFVAHNI